MKKILLVITVVLGIGTVGAQTPAGSTPTTPAATDSSSVVDNGTVIVVPPLFEYPVAPDDLPTIEARANWIMQNFWKPFDFKQTSVSQAALDHAFNVYITPLRWADPKVAEASIDELVKTLKKYPPMLYQFTRAAEHNLYSDKSEMWVDGPYVKFIDALLAEKKINNVRKARYKLQRTTLASSMIGSKMPPFEYITPSGKKERLEFTTPYTVVEFGDPFCSDCAMYKINLETFPELATMIADGRLNIYFIVPDGESTEGWERQLAIYPSTWKRGAGSGLDEKYDIRQMPSVYLLGADGTIINKFISSVALREFLKENNSAQ